MAYINGQKVLTVVQTVGTGATEASEVQYDPNLSHLEVTNVQDAIDTSLDITRKLAEECDYTTNAIINSNNIGFDMLVVETFKNVTGIDRTLLNGAQVIDNYWDANKHAIIKTSNDTLSIESTLFVADNTPYDAYINIDKIGAGSVNAYFSKNNGSTWTTLIPDTLISVGALVQKNIRIKLDLVGTVTLKNLYWGVK